jgi:hypothetical protein
MFRRKVHGPDGRKWKVGRRWLPHRDRIDGIDTPDLPFPDLGDADDIFGAILLVVFAVIAAVFLALLLFNVFVLAIEITILVLGLLIGLFSRVVLRKPWTVFAKSGDELIERHVVGWRGSKREISDLAGALTSGLEPARLDR